MTEKEKMQEQYSQSCGKLFRAQDPNKAPEAHGSDQQQWISI